MIERAKHCENDQTMKRHLAELEARHEAQFKKQEDKHKELWEFDQKFQENKLLSIKGNVEREMEDRYRTEIQ